MQISPLLDRSMGSNPCWNGFSLALCQVSHRRKKSRHIRWRTIPGYWCFGIGHNLSLICQTSEDIKHQLTVKHHAEKDHSNVHFLSLSSHTPSIASRHLPPNSAITGYATEGSLFISLSPRSSPPTLSAPSGERFGY